MAGMGTAAYTGVRCAGVYVWAAVCASSAGVLLVTSDTGGECGSDTGVVEAEGGFMGGVWGSGVVKAMPRVMMVKVWEFVPGLPSVLHQQGFHPSPVALEITVGVTLVWWRQRLWLK